MELKKGFSFPFVVLTAAYVVCLIVANLIAGKLWQLPFGITLTAGVLCFPIVYIINDIMPEVYGASATRFVIFLAFLLNLFVVLLYTLTMALPYPSFFSGQPAFETVLGFTPRLLVASFAAYLIGTNVNTSVLCWIKRITGPRFLWVRTITSTIFGEGVDSIIFMTIAFAWIVPWEALPAMIVAQALFKIVYEAVATPLTYMCVNALKRYEGVDQFAVDVLRDYNHEAA